MKKYSKTIKKLFSREKVGNRKGKVVEKPWVLQYKWNSEEDMIKHWLPFATYVAGWQDSYEKYIDRDHAVQQVNKELRSYFSKFPGRSWRIFNKKTKEVVYVSIYNKIATISDEGDS
jgi:hypothetical protein